jgi:hypothetical protein
VDISRRQFLKETSSSLALGVAASRGPIGPIPAAAQAAAESTDETQHREVRDGDMIYRQLGRTGETVSLIGLGGYHLGIDNMQLLDQALEAARTYKPMTRKKSRHC